MRVFILLFLFPILVFSQSKEELVDTSWKIVDIKINDVSQKNEGDYPPCAEMARLSFTEQFIITTSYKGSNCDIKEKSQKIEYKIKGNSLLSRDNEQTEWESIKIKSFSEIKMILQQSEDGDIVEITLEKVN